MFLTYEALTTFGISMALSFTLSVIILLILAARRGLFRVGANSKPQHYGPLLVQAAVPPPPKTVELSPLATYTA